MNILKLSKDKYLVESTSHKGVFYEVDAKSKSCACPAIKTCKHLAEVCARIQDNTI